MMNKHLLKFSWVIALFFVAEFAAAQTKNVLPAWALGGFVRPEGVNPIISPVPSSEFYDPMSKKNVHWEANDTFNPAAAVKDGKIVVLYRSEDKTGIEIGMRTSRLGYAESNDGLHFTRKTKPVFFPGDDSQMNGRVVAKTRAWQLPKMAPMLFSIPNGTAKHHALV
jgi:predicted GH43/DUF377 family glycosyl hydrolase